MSQKGKYIHVCLTRQKKPLSQKGGKKGLFLAQAKKDLVRQNFLIY